jgi:hypothetical protein
MEDRKHNAQKVIAFWKKDLEMKERLIGVEKEKFQLEKKNLEMQERLIEIRKANLKLQKEKFKLEKKNLENEKILDDNESRDYMVLVGVLEQDLGDAGAE